MTEEAYELKSYEDFLRFAEETKIFTRDQLQEISVAKLSHQWVGKALDHGLIVEQEFHTYKWTGDTAKTQQKEKDTPLDYYNYPFDQDVRQGLFESKRDVGPLKPILVAESKDSELNGLVIDSFHRRSVDPAWPAEYRKVEDWRQYFQLRFQSNIQHRRDHPQQLKRDLNAYCAKLAEMGVGKQSCGARAIEHLQLGYNPDYLRTLIDPQYKDQTRSEAAKTSIMMTPEEEKELEAREKKEEKSKKTFSRYEAIISMCVQSALAIIRKKRITKCPHCRRSVPVPPLSDFEEKFMQSIEHRLTT